MGSRDEVWVGAHFGQAEAAEAAEAPGAQQELSLLQRREHRCRKKLQADLLKLGAIELTQAAEMAKNGQKVNPFLCRIVQCFSQLVLGRYEMMN